MSRYYSLSFEIDVSDEAALLDAANRHAAATGRDEGAEGPITDPADALRVLLDPGAGGGAFTGDCRAAGFGIEESQCVGTWAPPPV